jgi:hypothetical protein
MTGDEAHDLAMLREFYAGITPRKSANAGGFRFRERGS